MNVFFYWHGLDDSEVWRGTSGVGEQFLWVFANPRLLVVAGDVVPLDPVVVEVVEYGQARFFRPWLAVFPGIKRYVWIYKFKDYWRLHPPVVQ